MSGDDEVGSVDQAVERLVRFERSLPRLRWALLVLVAVALVTASGWWLTSRDRDATVRNGTVADCRSVELALTLDEFQVIVSPGATDREKAAAGRALDHMDPLAQRYRDCGADEP